MFERVLVANRGDIAVRIIRTLKQLEITPVTVFAENDRHSLHVRMSEDAYNLRSGTFHDTYMNREKMIDAVGWLEADAVHPGYSFLADDPTFAKQVIDAGISWLGPPPAVLERLGNKANGRELAKKVGFEVIPGSAVGTFEEARDVCKTIGYPIIIKPSYGAGGLGIRVVQSEGELEKSFDYVRELARSAFLSGDVLVEKFLTPCQYLEVSFLADQQGQKVILPERGLSVQHQYQKLHAESPTTILSDEEREELNQLVGSLVKDVNYTSLGNVQFLRSGGTNYFCEVNTHIQLEHPLTEVVTGLDLVEEQVRVAAGEPLTVTDSSIIQPHGHAMQFRLNAEDPLVDFYPSTGVVKELELPGGPGIRFDHCIYRGYSVVPEYDTYLGQMVVWGATREMARKRALSAIQETSLIGFPTTLVFHRHLVEHAMFVEGRVDSQFVEESQIMEEIQEEYSAMVAALFAVRKQTSKVQLPPITNSRWRDGARRDAVGE